MLKEGEKEQENEEEEEEETKEKSTTQWEEALIPADETTMLMSLSLSSAPEMLFAADLALRDFLVMYFGAAYSIRRQPELRLKMPLKFVFMNYWSDHYIYGLTQWTNWWCSRIWLQITNQLRLRCDDDAFVWHREHEEHTQIVNDSLPLASLIPLAFQGCCFLENVLQDFVPLWPMRFHNQVISTDIRQSFQPRVPYLLQIALAALCQFAMLVDTPPEPPDPSNTTVLCEQHIKPAHEAYLQLERIQRQVADRLPYVDQLVILMRNYYYYLIQLYAAVYHDYPLQHWAWKHIERDTPLIDHTSAEMALAEQKAWDRREAAGCPPYRELTLYHQRLFETHNKEDKLMFINIAKVDLDLFPSFHWQ